MVAVVVAVVAVVVGGSGSSRLCCPSWVGAFGMRGTKIYNGNLVGGGERVLEGGVLWSWLDN